MCGIYGTTKRYSDTIIQKKLESIQFRGPDHSEYKQVAEQVGFGHNRLSIIDLDARSNQPMLYEHLWLVYNGEVYNFQEIKDGLIQKGYRFRTDSDSEVIAAAYLAYGEQCVTHFNGMFAFVIYDAKKNCLFGARDRLGQKPFYYTLANNEFEFASQIYPISIGNNFAIDENSITQYLHWTFIIAPNSIYKEIKKLQAGHYFTYDLSSRKFTEKKYWDIDEYQSFEGTYQEAKEELTYLIKDATKKRLIADVPIGVFLSGGIDSSLVAAMAQQETQQAIRTFSIKFNEAEFDESKYAQEVADRLQTNHTTILCSYQEGLDMIDQLVNSYQEPFADSSAIPTSLLSKHTRKHVTVALSGDAGDESFIGYNRYDWINRVSPIFAFPKPLRKLAGAGLRYTGNRKFQLIADGISCEDINELYIKAFSFYSNSLINQAPNYKTVYNNWGASNKNLLERSSDLDIKVYLDSCINTKVDRASMAYSLESRAPLEDYRVVAFARSLPTHFKYSKGVKKRILKEVLYQYLPREIFERPKQGFGVPLAEWFRTHLKEYLLDTLHEDQLKQIPRINIKGVQLQIKEHLSGNYDWSHNLWTLLVLANWMKKNC